MSYRNDIDALAARTAALEDEVRDRTRERDAAARLLEDAKARASRPVLDHIRIATPCSADWNQMIGDDRVRLCGACNKHVYNLSRMTRDEAEALITAKEGKLCARYFQRSDGTILLADCEVGRKQKQKRRLVAAGAAALLAGGGVFAYKLTRPIPRAEQIQGGVSLEIREPQMPLAHDHNVTAVGGAVAIEPEMTAVAGGVSFDPPPPPPPPRHALPDRKARKK